MNLTRFAWGAFSALWVASCIRLGHLPAEEDEGENRDQEGGAAGAIGGTKHDSGPGSGGNSSAPKKVEASNNTGGVRAHASSGTGGMTAVAGSENMGGSPAHQGGAGGGSVIGSHSPQPGVIWRPIAAGEAHSCAIVEDGRVRCWGNNIYGQLGDGDDEPGNRYTPTWVEDLTGVVSITCGFYHTCALMEDSRVQCWGSNASGQLGIGGVDSKPHHSPTVVQQLDNVIDIGAGLAHTCALLKSGSVRCWGFDAKGQIGESIDPREFKTLPVSVEGVENAVGMAVGGEHSCVALADGSARCWGADYWGQIGDGAENGFKYVPRDVLGMTSAMAVGAGFNHSCALLLDGTLECWGYDGWGQLGDGPDGEANEYVPVAVSALKQVVDVQLGQLHTCALLSGGEVYCWGEDLRGEIGDGPDGQAFKTVPVLVPLPGEADALTVGGWHTCAALSDGTLWCWGRDEYGQLGSGNASQLNQHSPIRVPAL